MEAFAEEVATARQLETTAVGFQHSWAIAVDRVIEVLTEPLAALLLLVNVGILASGVFSRYVLHNALLWSDELATILFLWLAMLGAVAAMRRRMHMRLSIIARISGPRASAWFDAIGQATIAVFCAEMLIASKQFFILEMTDRTPALNFPRSWEVAAIIVAMLMMLILAILRLVEADRKIALGVAGSTLLLVAVAWFGRGVFADLGNLNLILFFVVFVGALVAIGVPIAFCFGAATLSFLALTTTTPLPIVINRMEEGLSNIVLLAIPLFVLLGLLMTNAGIAGRLVNAIASVVGHIRGGLGVVLIFAMYLVSGISGSKSADMAAVAPVLFPEMRRRGLPLGELVALLNGAASMSETIPPSLVLIIMGSVTGVSIAALFIAGLMPAAVGAAFLLLVTLWRSRSDRIELAKRATLDVILKSIGIAIPGLALPLLIRSFVLGGIATATEVSTVGIIYTVLIGVIVYREFKWKNVYFELRETAVLTGAIMLIIAAATSMSWALTQSGFAQQLTNALQAAHGGRGMFMFLSCILFMVLGSVLEGIPAIVLFAPLLFPIAAQFGISDVQYAIVAVLSMGIGLHAPPIGVGYYAACIIGKASPDEAMLRAFPYLAAIAVALIFVATIPWLSIGFLPQAR
jgi:tripartite ATP-independent transporter DctM subunit